MVSPFLQNKKEPVITAFFLSAKKRQKEPYDDRLLQLRIKYSLIIHKYYNKASRKSKHLVTNAPQRVKIEQKLEEEQA
ncbi:hypothetical protein B5G50_10285 [Brevibacillus brevis]|nr:hypothetical protein B5G50_10285 [Brevibacillus brevis]